jgi:hypothetical protein
MSLIYDGLLHRSTCQLMLLILRVNRAGHSSPGVLYLLMALALVSAWLTIGLGYPNLSATLAGGLWISVLVQLDVEQSSHRTRTRSIEILQLWYECPYKITRWICLGGLCIRIEDSKIGH